MPKAGFGTRLGEKGFTKHRTAFERSWRGLTLKVTQ
jgi:hypothetical protein